MVRDREKGVRLRTPEFVFERYRIRHLRVFPDLDSDETVTLSAEIVNEAKPVGGVAGFVNLVVDVHELRRTLESLELSSAKDQALGNGAEHIFPPTEKSK